MDKKFFRLRNSIRKWGKYNIRDYPWRFESDPYTVLVSEFMLHRTQTKQVIPVFLEFMEKYPTLEEFHNGHIDEIKELLWPLGLNWRIDGMINALRKIWENYGKIPEEYESLIGIAGIGQYIAGATICFTKNEPVTIVDSNIVRVVGRVFGLDLSGEARRRKITIETIEKSYDPDSPQNFYYAIIDLAHSVCKPRNPECINCPLLAIPCIEGQII